MPPGTRRGTPAFRVPLMFRSRSAPRFRVPTATVLTVDGTELQRVVPNASVDLATAFRFVPNADEPLRRATSAAQRRHRGSSG